jgi:hypothetical protein
MSSRKTYFGIGVPGKDPAPTEKSREDDDRSDYSAPTVVDDAKVAEGLKQLRAWYQPDADPTDDGRESVVDSPSEPTKLGMPYPRPTAVGHSTSDAAPTEQRSLSADPMRGTMFGHDVHRPELDGTASANDASVSSTSQPADAQPRDVEAAGHSAWRGPTAGARNVPMAPFADFLRREAARPRPLGSFHLSHADDTDSIAVSRRRMTTNVLLAVFGVAAVVTAVMLGLRSATPEPTAPEPVAGTTSAGRPAGYVAPASASQDDVTKSATSLPSLPGTADMPAPPASAAEPVTALPRAPVGRPAPPATSHRAAPSDATRRTVPATRAPATRPTDAEQGNDSEATSEAAVATAASTAPERAEARPARNGRNRGARKTDSQAATKSERDTPTAGKKEDPDSTLPPSEE